MYDLIPEWMEDMFFFESMAYRENMSMYDFCMKYNLKDFWEEFYAGRKDEAEYRKPPKKPRKKSQPTKTQE